ncbi:MAG TPA: DUF4118 domain-containing protein, partial [Dehalococcoidia bacterium]
MAVSIEGARRSRSLLKDVGIGAAASGAAFAASVFCGEIIGSTRPGHPLFLVSILVAAWFGDLAGGVTASSVALLCYWLYLVPPKSAMGLSELQSFDLISFLLASSIIIGFTWWRRRSEVE